jgi:hypothetical protein
MYVEEVYILDVDELFNLGVSGKLGLVAYFKEKMTIDH